MLKLDKYKDITIQLSPANLKIAQQDNITDAIGSEIMDNNLVYGGWVHDWQTDIDLLLIYLPEPMLYELSMAQAQKLLNGKEVVLEAAELSEQDMQEYMANWEDWDNDRWA
jgi:hypothetical protein